MNIGITSIGALGIALIGLASGILILKAQQNLSKGELRTLMRWLFVTVILCGFPYAVWTFLLESELLVIENAFTRQAPGMILVALFFLSMFKAALVARKIGKNFGFEEEKARIKNELEKSN